MPPLVTPGETAAQRRRRKKKEKSDLDKAVAQFMSRGPIGMRTADTPWQEKQRPKRKKERIRRQRYEQLVRGSNRFGEKEPKSLRAGVGASGIARVPLRGGGGFLGDARDVVFHDLPSLPYKAADLTSGAVDWVMDKIPGDDDAKQRALALGSGQAVLAGLGGSGNQELRDIPRQLATQPLEAALYTPAFAWSLVTDPVETIKGIPLGMWDDLTHPTERAGYLVFDILGFAGMLKGGAIKSPKVAKAIRNLDMVEAVRIVKGSPFRRGKHGAPRELVGHTGDGAPYTRTITFGKPARTELPGATGRARAHRRSTEADLLSAEPRAVYKKAKDLPDAVGIAEWAVNTKPVTVSDIARTFTDAYADARSPLVKRRLKKLIENANEALRYVDEGPDGAKFKPQYAEYEALRERAARLSADSEAEGIALWEAGDTRYGLDPATAADRKAKQQEWFGGAKYDRGLEERLRTMSDEEFAALAERGQVPAKKTLDTDEQGVAAVIAGDRRATTVSDPALARSAKKQGLVVRKRRLYDDFSYDGYHDFYVVARNAADEKAMWRAIRMENWEPQRGVVIGKLLGYSDEDIAAFLVRNFGEQGARDRLKTTQKAVPGERVAGVTYVPAKAPTTLGRIIPNRTGRNNVMGVPRGPTRSPATGRAVTKGTLDPIASRAIARETSNRRNISLRVDTWKAVKNDPGTLTAQEFVKLMDDQKFTRRELSNWRVVRLRSANTLETRKFIEDAFVSREPLFSGGIRKNPTEFLEELRAAAADVDAAGTVKFFDNRKWHVQSVDFGKATGRPMAAWQTLLSAAKISALFSKLTGYITPQLMGMLGMQLIEEGLGGPIRFVKDAPRRWHQMGPEARAVAHETIGTGFGHALDPVGMPWNPVRRLNQVLADAFGVVMDFPFRWNSLVYWADQLGYKGKAGLEGLLTAKRGTAAWDDLNAIRDLIDEHYGRFTNLGHFERQVANLIWFYPWLRAASIYAARLPANHPARLAVALQGGQNAYKQAEEYLTEAFMRAAGLKADEALDVTHSLMDEYPGIFPLGPPDAEGNVDVSNPQAAALLQMPSDIVKVVRGFMGDEPWAQPLRMANPGLGLIGANLPGGYSTYFGESIPGGSDKSAYERSIEFGEGLVPALLLKKRLEGDVSDRATFSYDRGQAIRQYVLGSPSDRGLGARNYVSTYRQNKAGEEGPKTGPGRDLDGHLTGAAKLAQWARDNKVVPREVVKYMINYRKMDDALRKATTAWMEAHPAIKDRRNIPGKEVMMLKLAVVRRIRGPVLSKEAEETLVEMAASDNPSVKGEATSVVNDLIHYGDILPKHVESIVEDYKVYGGLQS